MEEIELEQEYKIDKDRLYNYYTRIRNKSQHEPPIKTVAKFLINQSIGKSVIEVLNILRFYEDKLEIGKEILDFAFEWIRAQKIRLEYKKYLIRAQYPSNDFKLAIDDCISLFFLMFYTHIRNMLKKDIKEHEVSALFEIFFSSYDAKNLIIEEILTNHKAKAPTFHEGNKRIDTKIITLRSGLSQIIVKDYERVLFSRKEERQKKEMKDATIYSTVKKEITEFSGARLERIIKTYCIKKHEIGTKEIESSAMNFLNSYFMFGKFYKYEEFKDILIKSLAEYMHSGLTEKFKKSNNIDELKEIISNALIDFRTIHKIEVLDGAAWVNDLNPVLKKIVFNFIDNLLEPIKSEPEKIQIEYEEIKQVEAVDIKNGTSQDDINFNELFDLNLEIEEFRQKLEETLKESNLGLIEKRNLIRKKVQEFTMQKRKLNLR